MGTALAVAVSIFCMFEQADSRDRNVLADWMARGAFALLFGIFGAEKFNSTPGSEWVKLFQEIGMGQWFRYFTGVVELLGAALLLIPPTVTAGLAILAATMFSAGLIWVFVLGRPANSIFCTVFLLALLAFWWNRRSR